MPVKKHFQCFDRMTKKVLNEAHSPATKVAYSRDYSTWFDWTSQLDLDPSSPKPIDMLRFMSAMVLADYSRSTIYRRFAALNHLFRKNGNTEIGADPRVRDFLKGLRRTMRGPQKKKALTPKILNVGFQSLSLRDQAVLLLGLSTGMRVTEMVSLRWRDVTEQSEGLIIRICVSKTDQIAKGRFVGVPFTKEELCPACTLLKWRKESRRFAPHMKVFGISSKTVTRIVKKCAELAGEDPSAFGSHSLRAGFMTTASQEGVALAQSMLVSGHKSSRIAFGYVRTEPLENVATKKVIKAIQRR